MPEENPRKMQVSIFRVKRISAQLRRASAKGNLPLTFREEAGLDNGGGGQGKRSPDGRSAAKALSFPRFPRSRHLQLIPAALGFVMHGLCQAATKGPEGR